MINTSPTRTALRKYAQGKSPEIQGAVRNVIGSMLCLEKDPNDTDAWKRLIRNHDVLAGLTGHRAVSSEDRQT